MTDSYRDLLTEMADELDFNRQCLMDNRNLTHPLADVARALLAGPEGLSPAAQAVLDAYNEDRPVGDSLPRNALVEALRALAVRIKGADAIRQDVLDIAAELENQ